MRSPPFPALQVLEYWLCFRVLVVPNPNSRVVLSQDRDRLGNLRASLDWRPVAQRLETIAAAERIIDASLRHVGLGYVDGR